MTPTAVVIPGLEALAIQDLAVVSILGRVVAGILGLAEVCIQGLVGDSTQAQAVVCTQDQAEVCILAQVADSMRGRAAESTQVLRMETAIMVLGGRASLVFWEDIGWMNIAQANGAMRNSTGYFTPLVARLSV